MSVRLTNMQAKLAPDTATKGRISRSSMKLSGTHGATNSPATESPSSTTASAAAPAAASCLRRSVCTIKCCVSGK